MAKFGRPDQMAGLAGQPGALQAGVRPGQVANLGQNQPHFALGHRPGVTARRVQNADPPFGRQVDGDVFDPAAEHADHLQAGRRLDHPPRDRCELRHENLDVAETFKKRLGQFDRLRSAVFDCQVGLLELNQRFVLPAADFHVDAEGCQRREPPLHEVVGNVAVASPRRQFTATRAPSAASPSEIARPKPRDPPVTSAPRYFRPVPKGHP